MKKTRTATLGLAGILAVAGCAHQYRTDANGVVHEYDCMGYEFTKESEARRQQLMQQNQINSSDAKTLVGLGLWGLGVKRNAPAGAQLGQDIFHAGLQESIANAGRSNVQQNVNVYNPNSGQQQFYSQPETRGAFFACNSWVDFNQDGKGSPDYSEFIGIKNTFSKTEKITFVARVVGKEGRNLKVNFFDSRGNKINQEEIYIPGQDYFVMNHLHDHEPGTFAAAWYVDGACIGTAQINVTD